MAASITTGSKHDAESQDPEMGGTSHKHEKNDDGNDVVVNRRSSVVSDRKDSLSLASHDKSPSLHDGEQSVSRRSSRSQSSRITVNMHLLEPDPETDKSMLRAAPEGGDSHVLDIASIVLSENMKTRIHASHATDTNPPLAKIPGRQPWTTYVNYATAYDSRVMNAWKEDMDILLLFAGLFSAVVTAFVVQSYNELSRDSTSGTNDILLHLSQQFSVYATNRTALAPASPNSPVTFNPSAAVVIYNLLWSLSLTFSLISALGATLIKQWARSYMEDLEGRTITRDRALLRQYLYEGLIASRAGLVVGSIPAILHVAVGFFLIGLLVFLYARNTIIAAFVAAVVAITAFAYLHLTVIPYFRPQVPFRTSFTASILVAARLCSRIYVRAIFDIGHRKHLPRWLAEFARTARAQYFRKDREEYPADLGTLEVFRARRLLLATTTTNNDFHQRGDRAMDWLLHQVEDRSQLITFFEEIPRFMDDQRDREVFDSYFFSPSWTDNLNCTKLAVELFRRLDVSLTSSSRTVASKEETAQSIAAIIALVNQCQPLSLLAVNSTLRSLETLTMDPAAEIRCLARASTIFLHCQLEHLLESNMKEVMHWTAFPSGSNEKALVSSFHALMTSPRPTAIASIIIASSGSTLDVSDDQLAALRGIFASTGFKALLSQWRIVIRDIWANLGSGNWLVSLCDAYVALRVFGILKHSMNYEWPLGQDSTLDMMRLIAARLQVRQLDEWIVHLEEAQLCPPSVHAGLQASSERDPHRVTMGTKYPSGQLVLPAWRRSEDLLDTVVVQLEGICSSILRRKVIDRLDSLLREWTPESLNSVPFSASLFSLLAVSERLDTDASEYTSVSHAEDKKSLSVCLSVMRVMQSSLASRALDRDRAATIFKIATATLRSPFSLIHAVEAMEQVISEKQVHPVTTEPVLVNLQQRAETWLEGSLLPSEIWQCLSEFSNSDLIWKASFSHKLFWKMVYHSLRKGHGKLTPLFENAAAALTLTRRYLTINTKPVDGVPLSKFIMKHYISGSRSGTSILGRLEDFYNPATHQLAHVTFAHAAQRIIDDFFLFVAIPALDHDEVVASSALPVTRDISPDEFYMVKALSQILQTKPSGKKHFNEVLYPIDLFDDDVEWNAIETSPIFRARDFITNWIECLTSAKRSIPADIVTVQTVLLLTIIGRLSLDARPLFRHCRAEDIGLDAWFKPLLSVYESIAEAADLTTHGDRTALRAYIDHLHVLFKRWKTDTNAELASHPDHKNGVKLRTILRQSVPVLRHRLLCEQLVELSRRLSTNLPVGASAAPSETLEYLSFVLDLYFKDLQNMTFVGGMTEQWQQKSIGNSWLMLLRNVLDHAVPAGACLRDAHGDSSLVARFVRMIGHQAIRSLDHLGSDEYGAATELMRQHGYAISEGCDLVENLPRLLTTNHVQKAESSSSGSEEMIVNQYLLF